MGQSLPNDKYSLELEIDRLKRDLARCEDDLARARKELDRKDDTFVRRRIPWHGCIPNLRDTQAKLASRCKATSVCSERFEAQQGTIKAERKELEAVACPCRRARV